MFKKDTYTFISDLIFKSTGMVYEEKEFYRLDSRINQILKKFDIPNEAQLLLKLKDSTQSKIRAELVDAATNNETYFFRDEKPFTTFCNDIIPMIRAKSNGKISIWSAGCSTGQEPYSLAMILNENFPEIDFSIEATDVSDTALAKAKSGIYTKLELSRGIDQNRISRHFKSMNEGEWQVHERLKSKISFSKFNLLTDNFKKSNYDIVFCRNVLIYQNFDNRKAIIKKLSDSLKPHGVLLLGSGESIIGMDVGLKMKMLSSTMVFERVEALGKKAA